MSNSEIGRLARFLNFRRSFPNPVTSLVHVPGFSYQDIDNTEIGIHIDLELSEFDVHVHGAIFTFSCVKQWISMLSYWDFGSIICDDDLTKGTKVQLWSLARLFEAARVFSCSKGPTLDCPDSSIVGMAELLENHLVFIAGSSIHVQEKFYRPDSPKFPLYIRTTVYGLGSTSLSFMSELFHEGTDTLYASNVVTLVAMSIETRRPTRLPDWWLEKYSSMVKGDMKKPYVFKEPKGQKYSSPFTLRNSETDTNHHGNWAIYMQHCCDSIYAGIMANMFPRFRKSHWDAGVRDVNMNFKAESSLGNSLTVESWENPSEKDGVCCRVMKGGDVCYNATFSFYRDATKNKL